MTCDSKLFSKSLNGVIEIFSSWSFLLVCLRIFIVDFGKLLLSLTVIKIPSFPLVFFLHGITLFGGS